MRIISMKVREKHGGGDLKYIYRRAKTRKSQIIDRLRAAAYGELTRDLQTGVLAGYKTTNRTAPPARHADVRFYERSSATMYVSLALI